MPLHSIKCLNVFLKGHGVSKENTMYENSSNKLLKTMNHCQTEIDKEDLSDCLFSIALDENTTRHKCATALMIRFLSFSMFPLFYFVFNFLICYYFFFNKTCFAKIQVF